MFVFVIIFEGLLVILFIHFIGIVPYFTVMEVTSIILEGKRAES